MLISKKLLMFVVASLLLQLSPASMADDWRPPLAKFTGSDSVGFPSDLSMQFLQFATIEFWVSAAGSDGNEDQVVLAYIGEQGPRFAIIIKGDRSGIGMLAADNWQGSQFDFSDGKPHHVAFVILDESTQLFVDGDLIAELPVVPVDLPPLRMHIGSLNGELGGFNGLLGGLRIWDDSLEIETLEKFKMMNIFKPGIAHPEMDSLIAYGDFLNDQKKLLLPNEPVPMIREPDFGDLLDDLPVFDDVDEQ